MLVVILQTKLSRTNFAESFLNPFNIQTKKWKNTTIKIIPTYAYALLKHHMQTLFKGATKVVPTPQQLQLKIKMMTNTLIFKKFCGKFENVTLEQLSKDKHVIKLITDITINEVSVISRAFQLAIEVTFAKGRFRSTALQKVF